MVAKNRFLIIKTQKTIEEIIQRDKEIGFKLPSPHFFFYKFEPTAADEEIKVFRGRPLAMPAALARLPARETERSIGICIYTTDGKITNEMYEKVSQTIFFLSHELGMTDWDIVSSELGTPEERVNEAKFMAYIGKLKNPFPPLRN